MANETLVQAVKAIVALAKDGDVEGVYRGYRELRPVRQRYGIGVLSTPVGILSIEDARKQQVGGEYLFEAW